MHSRPLALAIAILLHMTVASALADVIIWPPEPPRPIPHPRPIAAPRVAIESLHLDVEIHDGLATTTLHEVVRNRQGHAVQAQFVLPIPRGATVHSAALKIGDEWVEAEVMKAGEARQTYEDIVRRMIDPALIEYLDDGLLRTSVFPIPAQGTREIQLTLTVDLPEDFGTWQYRFPLKACAGPAPHDITVTGKVESTRRLERPYSPTHHVAGHLDEEGHGATFSLEGRSDTEGARDLQIFLPTRGEKLTVTVASTKPTGEDGYALLRITPGTELQRMEPAPKRIVFALDVSGSMDGEKLRQAKQALRYCLEHLDERDQFGLIAYEAGVRAVTEDLVRARRRQIEHALAELDDLSARGGTNIAAALATALEMLDEDDRQPGYVLLLTDGIPTVGTRDVDAILEEARRANGSRTRIFTFGVGQDVDPRLLDGLARQSKAVPRYVLPGEDLEASLGNLYAQIAEPIWSDLELELRRAGLYDRVPEDLGDLFRGQSVTVLARYERSGRFEAVLSGEREGRAREESFTVRLARGPTEHGYVTEIWAGRRIGMLQAELRAHGEQKELIDEIIRLATRYGIATPYTSLLMRDDDERMAHDLRHGRGAALDAIAPHVRSILETSSGEKRSSEAVPMAASENRAMRSESLADSPYAHQPSAPSTGSATVGRTGGFDADRAAERKVGRRIFRKDAEDRWIDLLARGATPRLTVQSFSAAYFELLALRPDLREMLSIGAVVWVALGEDVLAIGDGGVRELDDADRDWLASASL